MGRVAPAIVVGTLIALLGTPRASLAAPILQISGTELTGALNVNVGGTLYDVAFVEGTCVGLFTGCDNAAADFAFTHVSCSDHRGAGVARSSIRERPRGRFREPSRVDRGMLLD